MGQALGLVMAAAQLGLQSIRVKPKRHIGSFTAQVTFEEIHTDELEITDHPVELGAKITDHAFMRPAEVVIKCGCSDSPSNAGLLSGLVGAVTGTISGVASLLTGNNVSQTKAIYAKLLTLQRNRIPFDVSTGKRQYTNMLVKSLRVETTKETENSLVVTATLRQILIVTTQLVTVSAPASSQAFPGYTATVANQGVKGLDPTINYNIPAGSTAINPALGSPII